MKSSTPSPAPPFLLLALLTLTATAQKTILSCADVDCPPRPGSNGVNNACTLTNSTYANVGVSRIPGPTAPGMTWVEAIQVEDLSDGRHFIKDFYLGTDPRASFLPGCALFFTQTSPKAQWTTGSSLVSQGTCAEALSTGCVAKMVDRAAGVDVKGLGGEEACERVKEVFEEGVVDGECRDFFSSGGSWRGLEARAITGPGAPKPITAAQNASSDCWPVEPRGYDLTPVLKMNTTGGVVAPAGERALFNVVPILTVFFPTGNAAGSVVRSEAQLTCIKPIDLSVKSQSTMVGNDGGAGRASAGRVRLQGGISGFVSLMTVLLTAFLA
ncbi:hypothetical protein QBC39DRAFT_252843 [Podospora conica]|nr:hypothetical protein QBC39DRAFT_252843 [Schizothecium conicum]